MLCNLASLRSSVDHCKGVERREQSFASILCHEMAVKVEENA